MGLPTIDSGWGGRRSTRRYITLIVISEWSTTKWGVLADVGPKGLKLTEWEEVLSRTYLEQTSSNVSNFHSTATLGKNLVIVRAEDRQFKCP